MNDTKIEQWDKPTVFILGFVLGMVLVIIANV